MKVFSFQKIILAVILIVQSVPDISAQVLFEVAPLEFNTRDYDEFAPVVYGSGLVFNTSRRLLFKSQVDRNEGEINDLYFVSKGKDGTWGELQNFSGSGGLFGF